MVFVGKLPVPQPNAVAVSGARGNRSRGIRWPIQKKELAFLRLPKAIIAFSINVPFYEILFLIDDYTLIDFILIFNSDQRKFLADDFESNVTHQVQFNTVNEWRYLRM